MKISTAALPLLILAAALGSPTHGAGSGGGSLSLNHELIVAEDDLQVIKFHRDGAGVHRPSDCCSSYTPRNIRCVFMDSYYRTSSGCPLLAVIFITKKGQKVCADPYNERVQQCMVKLDSA